MRADAKTMRNDYPEPCPFVAFTVGLVLERGRSPTEGAICSALLRPYSMMQARREESL